MRYDFLRFYLTFVPFFSLLGVFLSALRIIDGLGFVQYFLLIQLVIDSILILLCFNRLKTTFFIFFFFIFIPPFVIGLLNNEISRRHLTDLIVPLYFFAKVVIFKHYWDDDRLSRFLASYVKVTFGGALVLIPLIFLMFKIGSATRISITAPLEVSYAWAIVNNPAMLVLVITLSAAYGKRAQILAFLIAILFSINKLRFRTQTFVFFALLSLLGISIFAYPYYSDSISYKRIEHSAELFVEGDYEKLSAGRFDELREIYGDLSIVDIPFGKGNGYVYSLTGSDGDPTEVSNAHFTPLGLLSKYGIFVTVSIYGMFIFAFVRNKYSLLNRERQIVYIATLIILLQSFFSYLLFILPILPMLLGAMLGNNFKEER